MLLKRLCFKMSSAVFPLVTYLALSLALNKPTATCELHLCKETLMTRERREGPSQQ